MIVFVFANLTTQTEYLDLQSFEYFFYRIKVDLSKGVYLSIFLVARIMFELITTFVTARLVIALRLCVNAQHNGF